MAKLSIQHFSLSDIAKLRKLLRDGTIAGRSSSSDVSGDREQFFVGKSTTIITAATIVAGDLVPGKGKVRVYLPKTLGKYGLRGAAGAEREVFNVTTTAIPIGETVRHVRDTSSGRWISLSASVSKRGIGKADAAIAAGSAGVVSVWRRPTPGAVAVDTGENITAQLDWAHGGEPISAGKEVFWEFYDDEGVYRITGAECE